MAVTLNIWGPNANQMLLGGKGAGNMWQPYTADSVSSSCIIDHVGAKANFNWPRQLLQSGGIAGVRFRRSLELAAAVRSSISDYVVL